MSDNSNPSQCAKILAYLLDGNTVTPISALHNFGCFRLGARILELRKRGHAIRRDMVEHNGKRYAAYSLERAA